MFKTSEFVAAAIHALKTPSFHFDFDGTLVEKIDDPEKVVIAPDVRDKLIKLSKTFPVSINTGRTIEFIKGQLPDLTAAFAASHGKVIQLSPVHEIEYLADLPDIDLIEEIVLESIEKISQDALTTGHWVERSDFSCNIHFRRSTKSEDEAYSIARRAALISLEALKAQHANTRFALKEGDKVIEICVAGFGKATALERVMQNPAFRGTNPVFFEDSKGGEDAMIAVSQQWQGLAVGIGPDLRESVPLLLETPRDLHVTLDLIAK
jgi:trehalose-phosphatase